MNLFSSILLIWLLFRLIQYLNRSHAHPAQAAAPTYHFDSQRNWALALAHPIACARIPQGYADASITKPALESWFRPVLLHYFRLNNDMTEDQICSALREQLSSHWYRLDLDALRPDDDPQAAMAFACARVAFAVRLAGMHGWLDEATQWRILLQNAQRASECFASWQSFGHAWIRGRRQWVARSRADSLGVAFDDDQVNAWTADCRHPWGGQSWMHSPSRDAMSTSMADAGRNPSG